MLVNEQQERGFKCTLGLFERGAGVGETCWEAPRTKPNLPAVLSGFVSNTQKNEIFRRKTTHFVITLQEPLSVPS